MFVLLTFICDFHLVVFISIMHILHLLSENAFQVAYIKNKCNIEINLKVMKQKYRKIERNKLFSQLKVQQFKIPGQIKRLKPVARKNTVLIVCFSLKSLYYEYKKLYFIQNPAISICRIQCLFP